MVFGGDNEHASEQSTPGQPWIIRLESKGIPHVDGDEIDGATLDRRASPIPRSSWIALAEHGKALGALDAVVLSRAKA